jgi:hypothetical protein
MIELLSWSIQFQVELRARKRAAHGIHTLFETRTVLGR